MLLANIQLQIAFFAMSPGVAAGSRQAFWRETLDENRLRSILWNRGDLKASKKWRLRPSGPAQVGARGKFGVAAHLSGGEITIAPESERNQAKRATLSLWVRPLPVRATGPQPLCTVSTVLDGFGINLLLTGECRLQVGANPKDLVDLYRAEWSHIAIVAGGPRRPEVFVNGKRFFMTKSAGQRKSWLVGGEGSGLLVSDLALWNRRLNKAEIDAVRNGLSLPKDSPSGPSDFDGIPWGDRDRDLRPPNP
jgi:hypothetical protein